MSPLNDPTASGSTRFFGFFSGEKIYSIQTGNGNGGGQQITTGFGDEENIHSAYNCFGFTRSKIRLKAAEENLRTHPNGEGGVGKNLNIKKVSIE